LQAQVDENPEITNLVTGMFMSTESEQAPAVNITNNPGAFKAKSWRPAP
jgi:hypothetical protein